MIIVVAGLKGGVGKTTTSVYLSAIASSSRAVTLVDADPQASAAEWVESSEDEALGAVELVEAPTDRLLLKALDRIEDEAVAIVDTPAGNERLLGKAIDNADAIVLPTRVGGVETGRAEAVLEMIPKRTPVGLVISSARTYTRDYHDALAGWSEAEVPVWGTIPERVAIAAGPDGYLAPDGIEAYRSVWRRVMRAARA